MRDPRRPLDLPSPVEEATTPLPGPLLDAFPALFLFGAEPLAAPPGSALPAGLDTAPASLPPAWLVALAAAAAGPGPMLLAPAGAPPPSGAPAAPPAAPPTTPPEPLLAAGPPGPQQDETTGLGWRLLGGEEAWRFLLDPASGVLHLRVAPPDPAGRHALLVETRDALGHVAEAWIEVAIGTLLEGPIMLAWAGATPASAPLAAGGADWL
jgi:hypothetical protein